MQKIASLFFLILLGGCSHCTTVSYRNGTHPPIEAARTDSGHRVQFAPKLAWAPLPSKLLIAVGKIVPADAILQLKTLVQKNSLFENYARPAKVLDYYSNIVYRSTVLNWRPTPRQVDELVAIEAVLLQQPNLFECIGIVVCNRPFARKLSAKFSAYQRLRESVAAASDKLVSCETSRLACESERQNLTALRQRWNQEPTRNEIEAALARYEQILAMDPEVRKIAAIDLLSRGAADSLPNSDLELLQWIENGKAIKSVDAIQNDFPAGYLVVDVTPLWFDYEFLALHTMYVLPDQRPYLADKPILIPKYVVLAIEAKEGERMVSMAGVLGNVLSISK